MYLQPVSLSQMVKSRAVKKADIDLLEGPFVNFFPVFAAAHVHSLPLNPPFHLAACLFRDGFQRFVAVHPHLWQEIQHPRVYSPALVTKPQAANGNFTSPSGRWHTGESLDDFAINPARSKSTMTKTWR